jgi:hypothetical protein
MDWLKSKSSPDIKHLASVPSSYVKAFGTDRQKHLAPTPAIRVVAPGNTGNHRKHLVWAASLQILSTSKQLRLFKTHDFDHKIIRPHHNCCPLRCAMLSYG